MIEQDNFGRNLPSAIVKYYTPETAKKAIEKFNDQKVLNSVLKVEPYKNIRK
jgi:RNA recognition motif-containing protein